MTLPRGLRAALSLSAIALLASALAVGAALYIPVVGMISRWAADYRVAKLLPPAPQDPHLSVAVINEQTLQQFPYREPVDRRFLSRMIRTLERRGARAIGIDILFDQPTEPDKDLALAKVLRRARIPIVVSYAGAESGLTDRQIAYLDRFVPERLRAFANLIRNVDASNDDTIRLMYGGHRLRDGRWVYGFPKAMAHRLGVAVDHRDSPIVWHGHPPGKPAFLSFPLGASAIVPAKWIRGRVVLIGANLTLRDRHRTPFAIDAAGTDALMPGVMIHAHAIAQLLDGRRPDRPTFALALAFVFALALLGTAIGKLPGPLPGRIGVAALTLAALWAGGFYAFHRNGLMLPLVTPTLAMLLSVWMTEFHVGRQERKQKRFITGAFERYIAPELVHQLIADPSALTLQGERREITFLFTDIASFTSLSEQTDPVIIGDVLNAHFDGVCPIVLEHGGTIVEFLGDSVFAIFGAPVTQPDHSARALRCAREVAAFARRFQAEQRERGIDIGQTRIGVHTGTALVGNFGSEQRFKYVPVGDAVNTASRIEGLNKHFDTQCCASRDSVEHAGDPQVRPLGQFLMKGKTEPKEIFEVLDPTRHDAEWMEQYRRAYSLMSRGEVEAAQAAFARVAEAQPQDAPTRLHRRRLAEGATDAVIVMQSK